MPSYYFPDTMNKFVNGDTLQRRLDKNDRVSALNLPWAERKRMIDQILRRKVSNCPSVSDLKPSAKICYDFCLAMDFSRPAPEVRPGPNWRACHGHISASDYQLSHTLTHYPESEWRSRSWVCRKSICRGRWQASKSASLKLSAGGIILTETRKFSSILNQAILVIVS